MILMEMGEVLDFWGTMASILGQIVYEAWRLSLLSKKLLRDLLISLIFGLPISKISICIHQMKGGFNIFIALN